jgi:hypothetical protein
MQNIARISKVQSQIESLIFGGYWTPYEHAQESNSTLRSSNIWY